MSVTKYGNNVSTRTTSANYILHEEDHTCTVAQSDVDAAITAIHAAGKTDVI